MQRFRCKKCKKNYREGDKRQNEKGIENRCEIIYSFESSKTLTAHKIKK